MTSQIIFFNYGLFIHILNTKAICIFNIRIIYRWSF